MRWPLYSFPNPNLYRAFRRRLIRSPPPALANSPPPSIASSDPHSLNWLHHHHRLPFNGATVQGNGPDRCPLTPFRSISLFSDHFSMSLFNLFRLSSSFPFIRSTTYFHQIHMVEYLPEQEGSTGKSLLLKWNLYGWHQFNQVFQARCRLVLLKLHFWQYAIKPFKSMWICYGFEWHYVLQFWEDAFKSLIAGF